MAAAQPSRKGRNQYRDCPVDRQAVIDTYNKAPGLTTKEIATLNNCDRTTVSKILSQYDIEHSKLEDFKNNRADILAGIQQRIVNAITPEEIKKAPIQVKSMMFGVFYDKERLERGQATEISVNFDAVKAIEARRRELADRIRALESDRPQDVVLEAEISAPIMLDSATNTVQHSDMTGTNGDSAKLTYCALSDVGQRQGTRMGRPRKGR